MKLGILLCLAVASFALNIPGGSSLTKINNRPVIGILSLNTEGENFPIPANLTSYIAESYVNWAEMAGSRVVPMKLTESVDTLVDLVSKVNGVIFTGGGQAFFESDTHVDDMKRLFVDGASNKLTPYGQRGCAILEEVKRQNDIGVHIPLWATCLGFELINVCIRPETSTMTGGFTDEPSIPHPLNFTSSAANSRLFTQMDAQEGQYVMNLYANENLALFAHRAGISPKTYTENSVLSDFYNILSTSFDRNNTEYVSLIEAKNYPIYGSQFHPEKNIFEWHASAAFPHSQEAVQVTTYLAQFFMHEARKNFNTFGSEEELKPYLIYNWDPYFVDGYFTAIYAFN